MSPTSPRPIARHSISATPSVAATDGPSRRSQQRPQRNPPHDSSSQPPPGEQDLQDEVVMTEALIRRNNGGVKYINQYELRESLGKGQHGEVSIAWDKKKFRNVAVKAVKRKNPKLDRMSQLRKRALPQTPHTRLTDGMGTTEHKIRKEIAIMKKCRHPHVVRLLEVIDDRLSDKIYMVMEYLAGGEIKWRTAQGDPILRVRQTRRICRDVILGLEYLHNQGIIHRDIKPANLLWTADRRTVKIADFGVSHFSYAQRLSAATGSSLGSGPSSGAERGGEDARRVDVDDYLDPILMDDSDLSKFAGTPMFLAPEIVADSTSDGLSASGSVLSPTTTVAATATIGGGGGGGETTMTTSTGTTAGTGTMSSPSLQAQMMSMSLSRSSGDFQRAGTPAWEHLQVSRVASSSNPNLSPTSPIQGIGYLTSSASTSNPTSPSPSTPTTTPTLLSPTPLKAKKPPITKAIDIWAFGVTLYGLLFGKLPFKGENEYQIYELIRQAEWDVPELIGQDKIWVGGRTWVKQRREEIRAKEKQKIAREKQKEREMGKTKGKGKERAIEGPVEGQEGEDGKGEDEDEQYFEAVWVIDLLEGLLQKDANKRMTLDDVKAHPWILRDMPDPDEWLLKTRVNQRSLPPPTEAETNSAISSILFRWPQKKLIRGLTKIFDSVRHQRSFRRGALERGGAITASGTLAHGTGDRPNSRRRKGGEDDGKGKDVGTRSAPQVSLTRHKSSAAVLVREKGKSAGGMAVGNVSQPSHPHPHHHHHHHHHQQQQQQQHSQEHAHQLSSSSSSSQPHHHPEQQQHQQRPPFEPFPGWASSPGPSLFGSVKKPRRGSVHSQSQLDNPQSGPSTRTTMSIPIGSPRTSSPQPPLTPYSTSPPSASQLSSPVHADSNSFIHLQSSAMATTATVSSSATTSPGEEKAGRSGNRLSAWLRGWRSSSSKSSQSQGASLKESGSSSTVGSVSVSAPSATLGGGGGQPRLHVLTQAQGGSGLGPQPSQHQGQGHGQFWGVQQPAAVYSSNAPTHLPTRSCSTAGTSPTSLSSSVVTSPLPHPHPHPPHAHHLSANLTRRSEDALLNMNLAAASRQSSLGGTSVMSDEPSSLGLTHAMRAASWGEVHDHVYGYSGHHHRLDGHRYYQRPSEDLDRASLSPSAYTTGGLGSGGGGRQSGTFSLGGGFASGGGGGGMQGEDVYLDRDAWFLGAGGIAQSPVPSLPPSVGGGEGVLSTVSSAASLGPPVISAAQVWLQRHSVVGGVEMAEGSLAGGRGNVEGQGQGQGSGQVQQGRVVGGQGMGAVLPSSHPTSPLAMRTSPSPDTSSSSSFITSSSRSQRTPSDVEYDLQPSTSQMYQDEDEESRRGGARGSSDDEDEDDEEEEDEEEERVRPIEVRTRRPSATIGFDGSSRSGTFMSPSVSTSTARGTSLARSSSSSTGRTPPSSQGGTSGQSQAPRPPQPQRAHSQRSERTMICT